MSGRTTERPEGGTTAARAAGDDASPPGSRLECAGLLLQLAADLLVTPVHLLLFLAGARRRRAAFRRALEEAAT